MNKILSGFKIANATIHYDETSLHMHVIGVPVIDNYKRGMKKQVGKSQLFTKILLSEIQDKMRNSCIKSYNKFYDVDSRLKTKQKERKQDINVKEMDNYREMKKKMEKHTFDDGTEFDFSEYGSTYEEWENGAIPKPLPEV